MAADPYVQAGFEIEAKVGGATFKDVVSISATFGLNAIPTASLVVAVGVDARTGEPATIHKVRPELKNRDPVEVRLKVKSHSGRTERQPDQDILIFKGYLSGIGYQRSFNNANFVIHVVHWLDDLNNTSAVHGDWFPSAPYDLAQSASAVTIGLIGTTGGAQPVPNVDPSGAIVTIENVQTDLWGSVLKPIFQRIASTRHPRTQCAAGPKDNAAAVKALEKIPDGAPGAVPLGLDLGTASVNVAAAIRHGLTQDLRRGINFTTLWNKIVAELGPSYFFSIAPCVEYAYPVPFFGGLKKAWVPPGNREYSIMADEYSYANFNSNMAQVLESVVIFHTPVLQSFNGAGPPLIPPEGFCAPAGDYPKSTNQDRDGLKLVKELPSWLTNTAPGDAYSDESTGVNGPVLGDTASGAEQYGNTQPKAGYKQPHLVLADIKDIADKFAKHWYKSELLQQRVGELSGKLRFDIAPGSTISIELPPRDRDQNGGNPDGAMFASVVSVSYVINAERAAAGTSFVLAHVRTKEENDNEDYTEDKPPLYKQGWPGGKLVKE